MKYIKVPNWIAGKYQDLTLYPFFVLIRANMYYDLKLRKHIAKHLEQEKELGFWKFYSSWIKQWFQNRCDYRKISFEIEAIKAELE